MEQTKNDLGVPASEQAVGPYAISASPIGSQDAAPVPDAPPHDPLAVVCVSCGKKDRATFCEPFKTHMLQKSLCFKCDFWMDYVEQDKGANKDVCVVVNGAHWMIGNENAGGMRGCYGDRFIIVFKDGRVVKSTNMWHQGTVPPHLLHLFPDNARFGTEADLPCVSDRQGRDEGAGPRNEDGTPKERDGEVLRTGTPKPTI